MNYEYKNIFDLEDIVLEQEYDMLNTLLDLIDKNELFIESGYVNNEAYDDFVNEMYSIYMEATERNKQQKEIAKYISDNGLDKAPVQKKAKPSQIRRMERRNNDPTLDEKYKNMLREEVKPSVASGDLTPDEADQVVNAYAQNRPKADTSREYISGARQLSPKRSSRIKNTLLQRDFDPKTQTIRSDVINKNGSYKRIPVSFDRYQNTQYDTDGYVNITPNDIQGSQANSNFHIGHELGHHKSASQGFNNLKTNKNSRAYQFIQDTKNNGQFVSGHDDGSYLSGNDNGEELEADINGTQMGVRTSKYGNASSGKNYKDKLNKGTRPLNMKEINSIFVNMSKHTKEACQILMKDYFNDAKMFLKEYALYKKNGIMSVNLSNLIYDYSGKFKQSQAEPIIDKYDDVDELRQSIEEIKEDIADLKKCMENNNISSLEDSLAEKIDELKNDEQELSEINRKISEIISNNKESGNLASLNQRVYCNLDESKKIELSKIYANRIEELYDKFTYLIKVCNKDNQILSSIMDSSTKMRRDFVLKYGNVSVKMPQRKKSITKQEKAKNRALKRQEKREKLGEHRAFVKEYFKEFFNEYYSLEYLFG